MAEDYCIDLLRLLPDTFTKEVPSNIHEIIKIACQIDSDIKATLNKTVTWRNIEEAKGSTLDMIGKSVGQKRGKVSDEVYRVLIRARIARNSSDGTINSMLNALALSLNTTPDKIRIKALYNEGQPASIMIDGIPIDELNRTGLTANEFGYLAQTIAAAGVKVTSIDLSGTFQLSSQPGTLENSLDFGLAPLDQSTGGTLGAVFDPNSQGDLPIN